MGGSWISAFFLVGLLLRYKNPALNRLRYFLLFCLLVLVVVQSLGKTALSDASPVLNSENLLVLLAPIVIIYGVSLFYTLLAQVEFPAYQFRYLVIGAFCLLLCLPVIIACFPFTPAINPVAYPPYKPTIIQWTSSWMKRNELVMSDIPWAVAWYGGRQCLWLTLDSQTDFHEVCQQKPVKAIYLTQVTTDARFQWLQVENSWGNFVFDVFVDHKLPPDFPLRSAPSGFLPDQFFITDSSDRWKQPNPAAATPSR